MTKFAFYIAKNGNIVDKNLHTITDDNKLLWGEDKRN